ncbi:MAG TPA: ankyrin repeat domain-containing protein [Pirellulales bacterium]|nr:ankyrin repeat domain-containing protein [Pirellulales bacterium]
MKKGCSSVVRTRNDRFTQFNLRQVLLLVALVSVLLGIVTPRIRRTFDEWRQDEEAERLATAGADLITAVRTNDVALARQALEAGATPDFNAEIFGGSGETRLLCACILKGQVEMMELLLDYAADVEHIDGLPSMPVRLVLGPVLSGPPLFAAAGCDQPPEVRSKMIRLLVQRGADPQRRVGGYGKVPRYTLMDVAFHLSDAQTGDLLREYGLPYGPREMAAFNRLDELKSAVQENPEILKERFRYAWAGPGPTLLAIALRQGYREMSVFLIESGAPLDTLVYSGASLLHEAAEGGDPELVRLLLKRGLDVDATDAFSNTPLIRAVWHEKQQAVAALLEAGAEVNHAESDGRTALRGAIWNDRIDIVRMLLDAGAEPTLPDVKGETPLDLARTRSPKIAELLEQIAWPQCQIGL